MATNQTLELLYSVRRLIWVSGALMLSALVTGPTCLFAQEQQTSPHQTASAPLNLIPAPNTSTSTSRSNRRIQQTSDTRNSDQRRPNQPSRSPAQTRQDKPKSGNPPKVSHNLGSPVKQHIESNAPQARLAAPSNPGIEKNISIATNDEKSLVAKYCEVIVPKAAQAILDKRTAELDSIKKELDQQLAEIARQRQALEEAQRKRDLSNARATKDLLAILSKMRPDAAAAQLAAMDETLSASLVARLDPRIASAILNEMPPAKAARMADSLGGKQHVAR